LNELTNVEFNRYKRHLLLKNVGKDGQIRLKNARVLIIGIGGLGSPIALYLAAAGIGTIGLIDYDIVDESNLQRQIIHSSSYIGISKVESAKERINALNPYIQVITYKEALLANNAEKICSCYDIIIGATDDYATRYLINEICVKLSKINIYGAINNYEGQVSVFNENTPCYECIYPKSYTDYIKQSSNEGVFGVLPGVIGSIQATEVIKSILCIGKTLAGKMLIYDSLNMTFDEYTLTKDSSCSICKTYKSK
jgi:adenylyltransferase/sulfurtransferase